MVLWIPVAIDKIVDFSSFRSGIRRQPFSDDLGFVLVYSLPILEGLTVIALIMNRFRRMGLILSIVLMTIFTGYIIVAMLGAWQELPCGCGSVISGMSWMQHLIFNLFFLFVSIIGFFLHRYIFETKAIG